MDLDNENSIGTSDLLELLGVYGIECLEKCFDHTETNNGLEQLLGVFLAQNYSCGTIYTSTRHVLEPKPIL